LIHEFGHAAAIELFGGKPVVHVWPGVQIYPNVGQDYSHAYTNDWPNTAIAATFYPPVKTTNIAIKFDNSDFTLLPTLQMRNPVGNVFSYRQVGFIMISGSGLNALVSAFSLLLFYLFARKPFAYIFFSYGVFLSYDWITYVTIPYFFDIPRLIFFGGSYPEPLIGANRFGLSNELTIMLSMFMFVVIIGLWYHKWVLYRRPYDVTASHS
jgi:hypothetical protein